MAMTESEKSKCQVIIHGHAATVAAGNVVTIIPGLSAGIDQAALVTMTLALAGVFDISITKTMATSLAVEQLKKYAKRKVFKEILKLFPGAGTAISTALTVGMIESAGWAIANEFASEKRITEKI